MADLHRLLRRQLRAHLDDVTASRPEVRSFVAAIDEAYRQSDTDRVLLERALELSSQELLQANADMRAIFQAFPDVFLWVSREGTVLGCRAPGDLFGARPPTDLVGRPLAAIAPADVAAGLAEGFRSIAAGGGPVTFEYATAAGEADQCYEARLFPLREHQVLVIIRDITERKRSERALGESERRHRMLFEANPIPLWVYDRKTHRFLAVNEAAVRQYGYSREEFLTMTIFDIRPPEDHAALRARLAGGQTGYRQSGTWRHRKKDGTLIDVEISSHPIEFDGRPSVLVLANDVTERIRLEEQFRQAQKMEAIGHLAGGIAHDFNNLLTAITGYTDLLLLSLSDREEDLLKAREVQRAAARAVSLTRQLLAFSRKQVLEPRLLNLEHLVAGLREMLSRLLGEQIELRTIRRAGLGRVKADPGQLEQVVVNLAVNARDAMPDGGTLTVELANEVVNQTIGGRLGLRPGPYVTLAVSDTGCGMGPSTLKQIFEPFFTTKEQGKGTGLGLSMVYGIVRQSGGAIDVISELGRGSTFRTYLPLVEAQEDVAPEALSVETPVSGTGTILVVEDDEFVRGLTHRVLVGCGYEVLLAESPREALAMEERHQGPIALVITDVIMPGQTGPELAKEIRLRRPETPILFVSGYTGDAIARHGVLDAGALLLQKPYTPARLAQKVREVLDGAGVRGPG